MSAATASWDSFNLDGLFFAAQREIRPLVALVSAAGAACGGDSDPDPYLEDFAIACKRAHAALAVMVETLETDTSSQVAFDLNHAASTVAGAAAAAVLAIEQGADRMLSLVPKEATLEAAKLVSTASWLINRLWEQWRLEVLPEGWRAKAAEVDHG